MDYELVKKLEEMGFPQGLKEGDFIYISSSKLEEIGKDEKGLLLRRVEIGCKLMINKDHQLNCGENRNQLCGYDGKIYKIPVLSELIEACGEEFYQLLHKDEGGWYAAGKLHIDGIMAFNSFGNGESPEEAVAKLYIALNK